MFIFPMGGRDVAVVIVDIVSIVAEILGDPYSKKSPLPSIDTSPRLAVSPKDPSYQLLGQSRIHQRHIARNNPTRILAQ